MTWISIWKRDVIHLSSYVSTTRISLLHLSQRIWERIIQDFISSKDAEYSFDNLRRRMLKHENSTEEMKSIGSRSLRNFWNELILVQIQKISSGSSEEIWFQKFTIIINGRDRQHQPLLNMIDHCLIRSWRSWRIISRTMISGRNPKDQNDWQMSSLFEKLWIMNKYEQSEECQFHCEVEEQDSSFPRFNSFQMESLNLH